MNPAIRTDAPERASWCAPATCGELVQGFVRGRWLQIAAPIDRTRSAWARVWDAETPSAVTCAEPIPTPPASMPDPGGRGEFGKVRRGLELLLSRTEGAAVSVGLGGDVLPRGVGFGSSTADLGAALAAAAAALGVPDAPSLAVDLALAVEPTNGSLLPGLALFDHREGHVREPLGPPPDIEIVCVRLPGRVDTVAFNRSLPERLSAEALDGWSDAFGSCMAGIERGDLERIGAAATASSLLARHLGCPPVPNVLLRAARETRALGVGRAHSGTVFALLYPCGLRPELDEVADRLWGVERAAPPGTGRASSWAPWLDAYRLVGGGVRRTARAQPRPVTPCRSPRRARHRLPSS